MWTGEQIEQLRKKGGWSLEGLANFIDVPPQTLQKWVLGEDNPTLRQLTKLSQALHVPVKQLLGISNSSCARTTAQAPPNEEELIVSECIEVFKRRGLSYMDALRTAGLLKITIENIGTSRLEKTSLEEMIGEA